MKPEDLKPGDQIIATEDAYFRHAPDKISQRKGDLIMVNNPNNGLGVGGTGLNGAIEENGRPRIGLGCSFYYGTFRRATPSDPGFLGTKEQWLGEFKDAEMRRLLDKNFQLRMALILSLWALVLLLFR